MEFRDIPKASQQKVYIDTKCINDVYLFQYYFYRLVNYLSSCGYEIVFDVNSVDDDTFFFTPCIDTYLEKTAKIFKIRKQKKILDVLYDYDIVKPYTAELDEHLFDIIDVPFVIKNEKEHGGNDKYLIKNLEHLKKFLKFYNEFNDYYNQIMAEYGHFHKQDFNSYLSTKEFQELLKNKYVLQQYIKTPTEYNTSLRVLTSLSGEVLASSLKYFSPNSKINSRKLKGISLYLLDESSPFYLGSESVISNTVSGGSSILLGRDNYNEFEKNILMAHNINPEGAKLPDNVKKAASAVARKCSQEIGAICGMDFIYSEDENKWYYLEEHEFPMLISYAEQNQLPYNFSREDPKQYCLNYQLADIDARLNSLSEYMKIKIKK